MTYKNNYWKNRLIFFRCQFNGAKSFNILLQIFLFIGIEMADQEKHCNHFNSPFGSVSRFI